MNEIFADAVGRVVREYLQFERDLGRGQAPTLEAARSRFVAAIDGLAAPALAQALRPEDIDLARCALVCWLDEMLTLHADWPHKADFRARCLELHYHDKVHAIPGRAHSGDRPPVDGPRLFYEAAEVAKVRPEADALETFLLCVSLGFQGRLRRLDRRREWVEEARRHIKERDRPGSRETGAGRGRSPAEGLRPLFGDHLRLGVATLVALSVLTTLVVFIFAVHARPY